MRRVPVVVLASALLLSACSMGGQDVRTEGVFTNEDCVGGDAMGNLVTELDSPNWVVVDELGPLTPALAVAPEEDPILVAEGASLAEVPIREVLRGAALAEGVPILADVAAEVEATLRDDPAALLFVSYRSVTSPHEVLLLQGEEVSWPGRCNGEKQSTLQSYVTERRVAGLPTAEVLRRLAKSEATELEFLERHLEGDRPEWVELSPSQRLLDPTAVPPPPEELIASLRPVVLYVDVPFSWRSFQDLTLCTRLEEGWNTCAEMDAAPPDQPLALPASLLGDQPLQVWLLNGQAVLAAPVAQLADLPTSIFGESGRARIAGADEIASEAGLVAAAAEQRETFRLVDDDCAVVPGGCDTLEPEVQATESQIND